MADPLRFGLIGCGSQGRFLTEAVTLTKQATLVACADVDAERAEQAASGWGYGQAFAGAAEMLDKADVDAVIVATIHDQLQPCGLAVVESGRHLFVEKPMALDAAGARAVVDAAAKTGAKVMVGYTLPFLPARVRMQQLIEQGAVGDIFQVLAGQHIGPMGGWLGDPAHGGGPLLYVGVHALTQVLHVVGQRVVRVFAEVDRAESGVDAVCTVTLRFEGGATAQLTTSQRMGGRYGWIDVLGSAGRVRSEWESNAVFVQSTALDAYREPTVIDVPDGIVGPRVGLGDAVSLVGAKYIRAWADEFAEFIAAIRDDRAPAVSGADAVHVLEITDAIFESGRTGRAVTL